MFEPSFKITNRITAALTAIERARGFLEAATLSDDWIRRMADRALVLEAHHTTHIEGTKLTLEQAERLMAGQPVPGADPDDTRELLNYRTAFDFVSGYLNDGGPVTEGIIRQIHKRLVEGVRGGCALPGEYRVKQNYVVNSATGLIMYTPPITPAVPGMMQELVDWLNKDAGIHPVLVSGIAQFQLVHIHPFCDGNGRTSRLLSALCLYRSGYDFKRLFTISEYYDRNRAAFYKAIQGVRDHGMDLTGWLEYFAAGLETQLEEVKDRGKRAIQVDLAGSKHALSERQKTALYYLLENASIDIQMLESLRPETDRRTLQRDLKSLVDKKIIKPMGATHHQRYVLAVNKL